MDKINAILKYFVENIVSLTNVVHWMKVTASVLT
jgi:hypothetical protein